MKIAVVGLGAAGLGAAWAAAERGHEVIGFEQFDLDNQPASSGGRGKIIRYGYDDPFYAALMRTTMAQWERLESLTGRDIMRRNGGLHMGTPADMEIVAGGIGAAGQPFEEVTAGAARLDDFGVTLAGDTAAVYEPAAGVMDTTQTRTALAEAATRAGARLRDHVEVTGVESTSAGVRLRTGEGVEGFDRAIVSAGPWAIRLATAAAPAFALSRRFQLVFRTGGPLGDGLTRPWMYHSGTGYYGMINVPSPDGPLHIAGLHQHDREQQVTDPGEPDDPAIRAASVAEVSDVMTGFLGLPGPPTVVDVRACHYTTTESHDFVVDDCPGLPGVVLLSACSGHGFKFTITTGAYAAALAVGEAVPDRDRFRLRLGARA